MANSATNSKPRFKNDPVIALILDTLNKKPVNSDYFSLVKRIKLSDYTKRPASTENNIDTVSIRSKKYMNEVGFAYGRLKEKNWTDENIKKVKARIHAPGPILNKLIDDQEEEEEILDFTDNFKSKPMVEFQKVKNSRIEKLATAIYPQARTKTTRPNTRISASQRQAREYLNYLNALNLNEHSYINSQITQKTNELKEKFENEAKKTEEVFNSRGIFSPEFNKQRVSSMLPLKMNSHIKVTIDPMIRISKDIVMKEKVKEWQSNSFGASKCETADTTKSSRKNKLLR